MSLKSILIYLLLLFSITPVFSQSNSEWSGIGLTASGKNIQNGVEAFYQHGKCNNQDVVFIKLINHNSFEVSAEWDDAIFTKDLKWVKNKKNDIRKQITIGGNEVICGNCSNEGNKLLVVKVRDFIKDIDDFKLYSTNSFKVKSNIK